MVEWFDDAMLVQDREDLIAVLTMRFGSIPGEIIQEIYEIGDMNQLQRLILAAANAPEWRVFLEELEVPEPSLRIAGERYNPLG